MDQVKEFLETSTVHGLSFISSTTKWSRLFWILVVFVGFSGAVHMIYTSFHNWGQSPIITTIETLPISELTLPNVTVCPPKNSLLNLNYDILHSNELKLDNDSRKELFYYALDVVQDEFYVEIIRNLSKVKDPDRYYNWYHGNTKLQYPYYSFKDDQLNYFVYTSATSGNMTTQYFGQNFEADNVERNIFIDIRVSVPLIVQYRTSTSLRFNLEKNTMKKVSENDKMYMSTLGDIDADNTHIIKNITGPTRDYYRIRLSRKVTNEDIRNSKQYKMPGFQLSWNYDKNVELWASEKNPNNQFTRLASDLNQIIFCLYKRRNPGKL